MNVDITSLLGMRKSDPNVHDSYEYYSNSYKYFSTILDRVAMDLIRGNAAEKPCYKFFDTIPVPFLGQCDFNSPGKSMILPLAP